MTSSFDTVGQKALWSHGTSVWLMAIALALSVACSDSNEAGPAPDGGTDSAVAGDGGTVDDGSLGDADVPDGGDQPDAATCPPTVPTLDGPCDAAEEGLTCPYGYDPAECGGRTVRCDDGTWVEESHTDPGPSCGGAIECGELTCGPNEYCHVQCTCCGIADAGPPSADYSCETIPTECSALDICECEGVSGGGLCDAESRTVQLPCA